MTYLASTLLLFLLIVPITASANVADYLVAASPTTKAALKDTIPVTFTLTSKNLDCGEFRVKLEGRDRAHTHIALTGRGTPRISDRAEGEVSWTHQEIHTGDSLTFSADAKIIKGKTGDTIDGFVVLAGCGQHYWFEVKEGTPTIAITAKSQMRTAKLSKKATTQSLASISDLNRLFRSVEGRNPTSSEWHYWAGRLLDKPDRAAFVGAIAYHKAHRIKH